jgi:hypothetical protein
MMAKLIAMYQEGAVTADHLAAECLHRVDPENPALVLNALPEEILMRVLEYARRYQAGQMVSNYRVLPAVDQIEAARTWIEEVQASREIGILSSQAD